MVPTITFSYAEQLNESGIYRNILGSSSTGSFRSAAKQLNISQPSVSQHIKKLESIFGSELFVRCNSGNQLTPAAQTLLPYAESLIRIFGQAKTALLEEKL